MNTDYSVELSLGDWAGMAVNTVSYVYVFVYWLCLLHDPTSEEYQFRMIVF